MFEKQNFHSVSKFKVQKSQTMLKFKLTPDKTNAWPNETLPAHTFQFEFNPNDKKEITIGRAELLEHFKVEGKVVCVA